MDTRVIIETIGTLTKIENVESLNVSDWLVLENSHPYPGYHSQFDADFEKPRTLFFITKDKIDLETLIRKNQVVEEKFKQSYDATPCQLIIYSDIYFGIRIKYLKNFSLIPELMHLFVEEGITFRKPRRISESATITIHKYFILEELAPGIYKDHDEVNERYIELQRVLSMDEFVLLYRMVKNNMQNNNFDAALAVFHRKKGIVEGVRIFEADCNVERLVEIQKIFNDQLGRIEK
ncbi:MAG TPA: hypothetical protein VMW01_12815 [Williamwhitmania sp.]|nr:hypothetical protein [Williamwhitmania sp.]